MLSLAKFMSALLEHRIQEGNAFSGMARMLLRRNGGSTSQDPATCQEH
jgi:hypothetical protein